MLLLGSNPYTIALSVGVAIFLMHITHTTYPPGGATALTGVQGHADLAFILVPVLVLARALILLAVARFTNNVVHHRQYPKH